MTAPHAGAFLCLQFNEKNLKIVVDVFSKRCRMGVKKGKNSFTTKEKKIMARKITEQACAAFMSAREFRLDNTAVQVDKVEVELQLHGHVIAKRDIGSNDIKITNAGWFSNTTKERLNGIPGVSIQQKKGVWFLNGVEWSGEWVTVGSNDIVPPKDDNGRYIVPVSIGTIHRNKTK